MSRICLFNTLNQTHFKSLIFIVLGKIKIPLIWRTQLKVPNSNWDPTEISNVIFFKVLFLEWVLIEISNFVSPLGYSKLKKCYIFCFSFLRASQFWASSFVYPIFFVSGERETYPQLLGVWNCSEMFEKVLKVNSCMGGPNENKDETGSHDLKISRDLSLRLLDNCRWDLIKYEIPLLSYLNEKLRPFNVRSH